jgi:DNA-binding MarR family transcriptional regulator
VPEALEGLFWETRRLFRALARAADEALEPLGISAGDRALIEFLAREPGPISIAELARKRSVSRQHIHQSLSRLSNPAWIERFSDPNDARSISLTLSASGRALWQKIRRIDRAFLRRVARNFDTREVQAATKTLRHVRKVLSGGENE